MNEQKAIVVSVSRLEDEGMEYYVGLNPDRPGSTEQTWKENRSEATLLPREEAERMVEEELEYHDFYHWYFVQWTDEDGRQTRDIAGVTTPAPVGVDDASFFAALMTELGYKKLSEMEGVND